MIQKHFSVADWKDAPLLSDEVRHDHKRLAQCPACLRLYRDDCLQIGSIMSPCCSSVALERGLGVEHDTLPMYEEHPGDPVQTVNASTLKAKPKRKRGAK